MHGSVLGMGGWASWAMHGMVHGVVHGMVPGAWGWVVVMLDDVVWGWEMCMCLLPGLVRLDLVDKGEVSWYYIMLITHSTRLYTTEQSNSGCGETTRHVPFIVHN